MISLAQPRFDSVVLTLFSVRRLLSPDNLADDDAASSLLGSSQL